MELENIKISDLVLFKNNQFIVLNKPPTIGVQADKTKDKALVDLAEIYCKCKLHIVHRIDRPASGIVLYAKNKKALAALNEQFKTRKVEKKYLAVVKNLPPEKEGLLSNFLKKNQKDNRTFIVETEEEGSKKGELEYKVIGDIDNYHLLEIDLKTGRHHQIRAQLAAIDCPIKGDVKYGFRRGNRDRSIHLHAWKLNFYHPVSNQKIELIAPPPKENVWDAFGI